MPIIYKPKGKAGEYASLALNIYKGCTHGCKYCYGPDVMRCGRDKYFQDANPKSYVIEQVEKEASRWGQVDNVPEILISFIGDPYQPEEEKLQLTRRVIEILIANRLPFTILTKGGRLARRDFDLLEGYPDARFGVSLSVWRRLYADFWEPNAPRPEHRVIALSEAKARGIKTWVSLEPVIDPNEALFIIEAINHLVDHWKVGKLNHMPKVEKDVDWIRFRETAIDLLEGLGADYYIKESLRGL